MEIFMGSGERKGDWRLREHETAEVWKVYSGFPRFTRMGWDRKEGDSFPVFCLVASMCFCYLNPSSMQVLGEFWWE